MPCIVHAEGFPDFSPEFILRFNYKSYRIENAFTQSSGQHLHVFSYVIY